MMKFKTVLFAFALLLSVSVLANAQEQVTSHLQDISVTVEANRSFGSGVLISRNVCTNKEKGVCESVNFVWTAAHVVDGLRSTRSIVDPKTGQPKLIVEFKDAQLIKQLNEGGRKVGEVRMTAKVIRYSDSEYGEDLALLLVRKRNFVQDSSTFFLEKDEAGEVKVVPIGTPLFHVGSLLGPDGSNSMTTGIVSQVGRVLELGNGAGVVFDQTTATAFPGSSGGGVFLNDGRYVGMLVRGAGETFNLIVPARRMYRWAEEVGVTWALDENVEVPTLDEILSIPIEAGSGNNKGRVDASPHSTSQFPFLISVKVEKKDNSLPGIISSILDK